MGYASSKFTHGMREASLMDPKAQLLDGWTAERVDWNGSEFYVVTTRGGYMATIDYRNRGYRSGRSFSGLLEDWRQEPREYRYVGRGWLDRLTLDVVAHLARVEG